MTLRVVADGDGVAIYPQWRAFHKSSAAATAAAGGTQRNGNVYWSVVKHSNGAISRHGRRVS